jgi:hypothetical protein
LCIAAHKKGISLESKRKRHPGKGRKNHHGIGRCFDARLDMPKAIAKGDDILVSRAFSIVCSFSYSYSLAIQYNGKLNLTSTRFVFSSMQNLLCTTDC